MVVEALEPWFREVYGGRKWILGLEVAQAAGPTSRRLVGWGCPRPLVVAARLGTGPVPGADLVELHLLGLPHLPMMEAIHAAEEAIRALPPDVRAAVERFDPAHEALALGAFFSDGRPVADRRFFGARPASWRRLEDKVVVDEVWDAIGAVRAPSEVQPLEPAAMRAAAARLDEGLGTVWAGDAARGFHGGATYTCHVHDDASAERALLHLRTRCERARVMPFLDGIPCSAHGLVFPDHVVVLRPAEMVVLRGGPYGFQYCRGGTCWDPPPERREDLRELVRRTGAHLRATLGYRGAFTVDGILTRDGFRPTELNPRVGAALGMMMPTLPFQFLSDALVEGHVPPVSPAALEAEILAHADAHRVGSLGISFDGTPANPGPHLASFTGGEWTTATAPDAEAKITVGAGASGGYANLELLRPPVGESLGPRAVAFARWLDRHAGSRLGPMRAALDVSAPGR